MLPVHRLSLRYIPEPHRQNAGFAGWQQAASLERDAGYGLLQRAGSSASVASGDFRSNSGCSPGGARSVIMPHLVELSRQRSAEALRSQQQQTQLQQPRSFSPAMPPGALGPALQQGHLEQPGCAAPVVTPQAAGATGHVTRQPPSHYSMQHWPAQQRLAVQQAPSSAPLQGYQQLPQQEQQRVQAAEASQPAYCDGSTQVLPQPMVGTH